MTSLPLQSVLNWLPLYALLTNPGTFRVMPFRIEDTSASQCLQFDAVQGKLIPFDVSQARISLGPKLVCTSGQSMPVSTLQSAPLASRFFRRRGSAPSSPSSTSLWRQYTVVTATGRGSLFVSQASSALHPLHW